MHAFSSYLFFLPEICLLIFQLNEDELVQFLIIIYPLRIHMLNSHYNMKTNMAAIANKLYLLAKQKPMDCRFPENDAYHRDEIEYKTHASNSLHFQRLSLSVRNFFSSLSCGAKT